MIRFHKKTHFLIGLLILVTISQSKLNSADPYSPKSRFSPVFSTTINSQNQFELKQVRPIHVNSSIPIKLLSLSKAGGNIVKYSFIPESTLSGSPEEIISQTNQERFDPSKPYPITGGHYSDLYVRNLGIFFNSLLDPRTDYNSINWENRERIALQTTALDLELLKQSPYTPTTFIPVTKNTFTLANIYAPASDSLFSVLYTLNALSNPQFLTTLYPSPSLPVHTLQTQTAASNLINQYRPTLTRHLGLYKTNVLDPKTGLINTNLRLSSARDGIKRQSSFYDNVIAWSTFSLANDLEIYPTSTQNLETWKQKIITTFWDENLGIFKNDLSHPKDPLQNFSADTLIVLNTGFLNLNTPKEKEYLKKTVSFIREHQLDQPFPLRYSFPTDPNNLYPTVRFLTKGYMDNSIWCHWGMEYIKTLTLLSSNQPEHLALAHTHLKTYENNITKFGGYPELYSLDGNIFKTRFYKSVLHTGWVINYQQTQFLVNNTPVPSTN